MKTLLFHNYRPERLVHVEVRTAQVSGDPDNWEGVNKNELKIDKSQEKGGKVDLDSQSKRLAFYTKAETKARSLEAHGKTALANKLKNQVQEARNNEQDRLEDPDKVALALFKNLLRISGMMEKDPALTAQDYASKVKLDEVASHNLPMGTGATEKGTNPTEKVAPTQADPTKIALNKEGNQMEKAITSSGTLTKKVISAPSSAPAMPQTKQT